MVPPPPRRVFVSHTSELASNPERRSFVAAVVDAITAVGDVPVHMGQFGARPRPPVDECVAEVELRSLEAKEVADSSFNVLALLVGDGNAFGWGQWLHRRSKLNWWSRA